MPTCYQQSTVAFPLIPSAPEAAQQKPVLRCYTLGTPWGRPFFVMELVNGVAKPKKAKKAKKAKKTKEASRITKAKKERTPWRCG